MLRQQTVFNIYEPKISIYDIHTNQCLSLNENQTEAVTSLSSSPQESMFQITLLLVLLRENNCAKLF